jgi:hypothetical protein
MKLKNAEANYMDISYTKLHGYILYGISPESPSYVKNAGTELYTHRSEVGLSPNRPQRHSELLDKIS